MHGGCAAPFTAWFLRAAGFFPGQALPAESQEKHIGRWIHRPQRAVEIKRSDSGLEIPALRKHYLKNISGGDVLLGAPDAFEEWDSINSQRMVGKIFDAMDLFLGGVGIVTLCLGALGVVNIMLVSVAERTREIGLRKALGATKRNIMLQFLLEGMFLTGISGAVGIAAAASLMLALNAAVGTSLQGFDAPRLVPWSAALALGALCLSGIVAGVYPAGQAANLDPVEALRRE